MDENSELGELQKIYRQLDPEGRKKMAQAAAELLYLQGSMEMNLRENTLNSAQLSKPKKAGNRGRPFALIIRYILMGGLLFGAALSSWVILVKPALLMIGPAPLLMLRIIASALCGLFCMGAGIVFFLLGKLKFIWMLLALGAGILCIDPLILTDLIGIIFLAMILFVQLYQWKRQQLPGL